MIVQYAIAGANKACGRLVLPDGQDALPFHSREWLVFWTGKCALGWWWCWQGKAPGTSGFCRPGSIVGSIINGNLAYVLVKLQS